MKKVNQDGHPKWGLFLLILLAITILCCNRCRAQKQEAVYDTIRIESTCITKYVTQSTEKSVKIFAVYTDKATTELIPVSKSVYDYIALCEENKIVPSLAIKLRNGKISSLIKYQKKFKK